MRVMEIGDDGDEGREGKWIHGCCCFLRQIEIHGGHGKYKVEDGDEKEKGERRAAAALFVLEIEIWKMKILQGKPEMNKGTEMEGSNEKEKEKRRQKKKESCIFFSSLV